MDAFVALVVIDGVVPEVVIVATNVKQSLATRRENDSFEAAYTSY